jgi:Bacterial regulatory helix-turn-helix protein, lysR family
MLEQIRSFLTVVEEGSLHRVAVRLRISPSAVSRQMQVLELELGGRLLERMATGVRSFLAQRVPSPVPPNGQKPDATIQTVITATETKNGGYSKYWALIPPQLTTCSRAIRPTLPEL